MPKQRTKETERGNRHALRLSLQGVASNRDAIGSTVTVEAGKKRLVRQVTAGGSYLSQGDTRLLIGVDSAVKAKVSIRWPSGLVQTLDNVPVDTPLLIVEGKEPS